MVAGDEAMDRISQLQHSKKKLVVGNKLLVGWKDPDTPATSLQELVSEAQGLNMGLCSAITFSPPLRRASLALRKGRTEYPQAFAASSSMVADETLSFGPIVVEGVVKVDKVLGAQKQFLHSELLSLLKHKPENLQADTWLNISMFVNCAATHSLWPVGSSNASITAQYVHSGQQVVSVCESR